MHKHERVYAALAQLGEAARKKRLQKYRKPKSMPTESMEEQQEHDPAMGMADGGDEVVERTAALDSFLDEDEKE